MHLVHWEINYNAAMLYITRAMSTQENFYMEIDVFGKCNLNNLPDFSENTKFVS